MVLHELATNAAKYGALSTADGRVEIAWAVADRDGAPWLTIRWTESDGPPVVPPTHQGFGHTLVQQLVGYELQGTARTDFAATGVVCSIELPFTEKIGVRESQPGPVADPSR